MTIISATSGIHHVTGIAGDAQRNVDFYAGVLGMRLVKKTVNFDDPRTYHLYYGDEEGTPGSILTFFPWPGARAGRAGAGQVGVVSLSVPPEALGFWLQRFVTHGVEHELPSKRFGEPVLRFKDRDGLQLELVATRTVVDSNARTAPGISAAHAVRGVHSVTVWEHALEETERALVDGFGFRKVATEESTTRFASGAGARGTDSGTYVDVRVVGGFLSALQGVGTIHHVAFRADDDDVERALREQMIALGMHPTQVIDRHYFRSVYAREAGGVLFEIATDAPGFTVDEPLASLGESLKLPSRFEARRGELERALPPLHAPLQAPLQSPFEAFLRPSIAGVGEDAS